MHPTPLDTEFARRAGVELPAQGPSPRPPLPAPPGTGDFSRLSPAPPPTALPPRQRRKTGPLALPPTSSPEPPPPVDIQFTVSGEPRPQPRPRAFARKLPNGTCVARVFDAGTAEGWKSRVAVAAQPFLPAAPCTQPLAVTLIFEMARPMVHYTTKGALKRDAPVHPTGRYDVDNLAKAVLDALTQIGLWRDDGQVVRLDVSKRYALRSGACVEIREMPGCETR